MTSQLACLALFGDTVHVSSLDPTDPRPPYQQVANALRAAILTGTFSPGDQLPSQSELALRYGVARMTIQQSLRVLRGEGLIISRQGSGVFVRAREERATQLRPHIQSAFASDEVTVDFAGFSGETLHGALIEPLDQIRTGRLTPSAVSVRMLLPDLSLPAALPVAAGQPPTDDPEVRERSLGIMRRHASAIVDEVSELVDFGLIQRGSAQIRLFRASPLFKLYVINGQEAFFGFYPVLDHEVTLTGGRRQRIFDPMGKDTILFHHGADSDTSSVDSQFVAQAQTWFESLWVTLGQPATL